MVKSNSFRLWTCDLTNCFVVAGSATNSDSMLSFSSSGVSSTGSLHLSTASEVEDILEPDPACSKIHISSTYISSIDLPHNEATNIEVRSYQNANRDHSPHIFLVNDHFIFSALKNGLLSFSNF